MNGINVGRYFLPLSEMNVEDKSGESQNESLGNKRLLSVAVGGPHAQRSAFFHILIVQPPPVHAPKSIL